MVDSGSLANLSPAMPTKGNVIDELYPWVRPLHIRDIIHLVKDILNPLWCAGPHPLPRYLYAITYPVSDDSEGIMAFDKGLSCSRVGMWKDELTRFDRRRIAHALVYYGV